MSSHHHAHCPACSKVLPVKYGMPAACSCGWPATPPAESVSAESPEPPERPKLLCEHWVSSTGRHVAHQGRKVFSHERTPDGEVQVVMHSGTQPGDVAVAIMDLLRIQDTLKRQIGHLTAACAAANERAAAAHRRLGDLLVERDAYAARAAGMAPGDAVSPAITKALRAAVAALDAHYRKG